MGSIIDNRITVTDAESTTGWNAGALDNEIFIEGSNSLAQITSTTRLSMIYDFGAIDVSNNIFYIWVNCGVVPLLDPINLGGFTVRFCGATITNYFEVYVGGSDFWPKAVQGGWTQFVVDIEIAHAIATGTQSPTRGGTGGTAPATNQVEQVGISAITTTIMPKHVDNTWIDAIYRLPKGEPGITIAGQNETGSPFVPYAWQDVLDAADYTDPTKAWGTAKKLDGVVYLNTPVQFGNDGSPDSGDHDFEDTNIVAVFEEHEFIDDDFYFMDVVGDGVNTQRFVAGVKTGTGDDAVGSQGWTVLSSDNAPRWNLNCFDAEIDDTQWQGCTMINSGVIDIDNANVEMRSTLLLGGQRLWHSRSASPRSGAEFQKNSVSGADPISFDISPAVSPQTDYSYILTSDPDKVKNNSFLFSDGHALRVFERNEYVLTGNVFTGYDVDGTPDAAISVDLDLTALLQENTFHNITGPLSFSNLRRSSARVTSRFIGNGSELSSARVGVATSFNISPHPGGVQLKVYANNNSVSPQRPGTLLAASDVIPAQNLVDGNASPVLDAVISFIFTSSPRLQTVNGEEYWLSVEIAPGSPVFGSPGLLYTVLRTAGTGGAGSSPVLPPVIGGNPFGVSPLWNSALIAPNDELQFEIYGLTSPAETIFNIVDGATPTVHDENGTGVTINNNVNVTLTNIEPGTEIRVYPAQDFYSPVDLTELAGIEDTGSPSEFTFSAAAGTVVDIVVLNLDYVLPPANRIRNFTVPATSSSFPISQVLDRNFSNPD